jgi:hypothetical protein
VNQQQPQDLDTLIDASAAALGIAIAPEWKPGIAANLAAALSAAAMQAEFDLPDEAEPAPTFEA